MIKASKPSIYFLKQDVLVTEKERQKIGFSTGERYIKRRKRGSKGMKTTWQTKKVGMSKIIVKATIID